jgi:hypothetical protein
MNINLNNPVVSGQFELIISEPGGAVLLDTIATGGQPVIAAHKTNDTLVDVTTVLPDGNGHFTITTFKSINAATFTGLATYGYVMAYGLKPQGTMVAKIHRPVHSTLSTPQKKSPKKLPGIASYS